MTAEAGKALLNATVSRRIDVARGLFVLRVAPDGWALRGFDSGQYTTLGLPDDGAPVAARRTGWVRRPYSIASSPSERGYREFFLVHLEQGGLTPRLFKLSEGDRLWLSPRCEGTFVASRAPLLAWLVFVATGTGVAPFMSMLRMMRETGSRRRVALLHGVRHAGDLAYHAELKAIASELHDFTYLPVVSRADETGSTWKGNRGRVQDVWREGQVAHAWGARPVPGNTHVFLCGNPAMIDDMIALLGEGGFLAHTRRRPGQIHVERYW